MPELPEVESVVRNIRPHVWGCRISAMVCSEAGKLPEVGQKQVQNRVIRHVGRRGKYIFFSLNDGFLVSHLRMTGQWLFSTDPPYKDKAFRWAFSIDDLEGKPSGYLWFRDPRKFGTMVWVPSLADYEPLERLGPDGLDLDDPKVIQLILLQAERARRPIKTFLLDQNNIAGLGNIYVSETLYETGVDPTTPTQNLSVEKIKEICEKAREIFLRAIDLGGSSISDYTGGHYHKVLHVYGREGEPCDKCGGPIKRITQSGRSTFFCPNCQGDEDGNY
jgi:formamidopyrimidine-DNA glycosylase